MSPCSRAALTGWPIRSSRVEPSAGSEMSTRPAGTSTESSRSRRQSQSAPSPSVAPTSKATVTLLTLADPPAGARRTPQHEDTQQHPLPPHGPRRGRAGRPRGRRLRRRRRPGHRCLRQLEHGHLLRHDQRSDNGDLGKILVDAKGRTVYLFEKDTGPMSTCFGACAADWPPVTTTGKPTAGSGVTGSMLATTKRSDGHDPGRLQRPSALPVHRRPEGGRHQRAERQRVRRRVVRAVAGGRQGVRQGLGRRRLPY